ncbi:MAG: Holliday junction branch migration protein RuvA [Lachnospiraceae bacterium]|nr:Holliday junction branch migration protein RuvA [Lachnospiraceae bacterium]MEE0861984.1 Holliday junction branch migration protein RuvA [Lachnospiraceae bacterium]
MIGFVNGEIEEMYEDRVLIDCGFMGYNIFVCGNVLESCSIGQEIKLYTYLNVREDAMNLFGFLSKDELKVFKLLITVNGIGPKGALAILTIMSPNDLRYAIMTEDSKLISKAPGVGAKTAQKVILELKDKLDMDAVVNIIDDDIFKRNNDNVHNEIIEEAVEALVSLGYTQKEITKIIKSCDITECKTTEDVIKLVLKNI